MAKNIVIVGAGPGGLSCGLNLVNKLPGYNITIVEHHPNLPGGLSQSWKRRTRVEPYGLVTMDCELTHRISGMREGEHNYKLLKDLGFNWDNVGDMNVAPLFAQYIVPGKTLEVPSTYKAAKKYFKDHFPQERRGVDQFFKFLDKLEKEKEHPKGSFKRNLEDRCNSWLGKLPKFLQFPTKALTFSYTKPTFVKYRNKTFKQILDKFFNDDDLKASLGSLYGYVGLRPSEASGLFFSLVLNTYWRGGGPQAPAEGSYQKFHDEMAEAFKRKGGTIHYGTTMEDILVKDNKVKGIVVRHRGKTEKIYVDIVVGAGDPKLMLEPVKDDLPSDYWEMIDGFEECMSFSGIHILTDLPLHEEPYASGLRGGANIIGSSLDAFEKENGSNFPKHHTLYVNSSTFHRKYAGIVSDKDGNSIPGLHFLDIVMRGSDFDGWVKLKKRSKELGDGKYQAKKDKLAATGIGIIDKMLLPGLKDQVLWSEVYTLASYDPWVLTNRANTLSIKPTPENFINRPSPNTPIDGLYLAGAIILSAGVLGAMDGGRISAEKIVKDVKRK